ncbi:MAG: hypothetical protein D6805_05070 [Planctomycetota bacterium]|nr:MAG: hypothetical protein D6805_05070 [Planctomycetota bacterium]
MAKMTPTFLLLLALIAPASAQEKKKKSPPATKINPKPSPEKKNKKENSNSSPLNSKTSPPKKTTPPKKNNSKHPPKLSTSNKNTTISLKYGFALQLPPQWQKIPTKDSPYHFAKLENYPNLSLHFTPPFQGKDFGVKKKYMLEELAKSLAKEYKKSFSAMEVQHRVKKYQIQFKIYWTYQKQGLLTIQHIRFYDDTTLILTWTSLLEKWKEDQKDWHAILTALKRTTSKNSTSPTNFKTPPKPSAKQ